jgi:very-short-patch-repair endonuclease
LRRDQTDAEAKLWERLRAGRLNGIKFRRQAPIGQFIVDFCCNDYSLVIELDGGQHAEPGQLRRDERRTQIIEQYGYRVIRFWDNEIFENMEGVLEAIIQATRSV